MVRHSAGLDSPDPYFHEPEDTVQNVDSNHSTTHHAIGGSVHGRHEHDQDRRLVRQGSTNIGYPTSTSPISEVILVFHTTHGHPRDAIFCLLRCVELFSMHLD